jgi:hypothetical protein
MKDSSYQPVNKPATGSGVSRTAKTYSKLIKQVHAQNNAAETSAEQIFHKADLLLFKDKNIDAAEALYKTIDPPTIDSLLSIALCMKYKSSKAGCQK